MIQKTRLSLGDRSYDVRIGAGAIAGLGGWLRAFPAKKAFLISDRNLRRARAATVQALRAAGWEVAEIAVTAGEGLKEISAVYGIYGELLERGANRDAVLFALGGGTVGDSAGFIAATYLRGIPWIGLPTTLLAQVDSAIGGKTGINHASGKNLIGAVYQPALVVCDTDFLRTLAKREVVSGFGEVVKYGIVFDPSFYRSLVKDVRAFVRLDPKVLQRAIKKSAEWKCRTVAQDEWDRRGAREVLNFGHTFGHALESATKYGTYQHGEAVIWGMRFAIALSEIRGHLKVSEGEEIDVFLRTLPVPPLPKRISAAELFAYMKKDKKVRGGRTHFVLLKKVGQTVSDPGVTPDDLQEAYARLVSRKGAE